MTCLIQSESIVFSVIAGYDHEVSDLKELIQSRREKGTLLVAFDVSRYTYFIIVRYQGKTCPSSIQYYTVSPRMLVPLQSLLPHV